MIRIVSSFLFLAMAGSVHAQTDPLTSLRQNADKTAATWQALAKGLESKISTLLPCDPKGRAAVDEVSRASEARLNALSAYLKAAVAKAKGDTEAAKRVLAAQAALAGGWNTERVEADQERLTIEAQVADLKESMRKRAALAGAEQVLEELLKTVKARIEEADQQSGTREAINAALGNLVVAYQDRQTALEAESGLVDVEGARWSAYYAARLSRAITECTIINPGAAKRKRP